MDYPTITQFCNPKWKSPWHKEPKIRIYDRSPRLSMEEILRKKANNSKRYELKKEIKGSEIKELMSHTCLYHGSAFSEIRHNTLSVESRLKRLNILSRGYYELKYSRKNIDIMIYQNCSVIHDVSKIIRVNNKKKKICGTDTELVKRVFRDYIK